MAETKINLADTTGSNLNIPTTSKTPSLLDGMGSLLPSQNFAVEAEYHRVIKLVKTQYMKPGSGEIYYEQDLRNCSKCGVLSMHAFVTPNFSWSLQRSLGNQYQVSYAFDN